jgi:crotonobetaine/carnitine-CoA ligase
MIDDEMSMPEMIDGGVLLPNRVASLAATDPDRPFLSEVGNERCLTYGQAYERSRKWAAAWLSLGVQGGDRVMCLMPPRIEWFTAWLGLAHIRGVEVALNTDFHGHMLHYAVKGGRARILLTVRELLDKITADTIADTDVETIVVIGGNTGTHPSGVRLVAAEELLQEPLAEEQVRFVQPYDTSMLVLTSGTTGPSKYVLLPWGAIYAGSHNMPLDEMTREDVLYQALPIYHGAARFMIAAAIRAGGRCVFRDSLSVSDFWSDIRGHGCTLTFLPGPTVPWFLAAPDSPGDADTPLRMVFMVPVPPMGGDFAKRFGLRIRTGWGGSETCLAAVGDYDPAKPTSSGRVRTDSYPNFEFRVVDEHGSDLPAGEAGEVILRPRQRWGMFTEYFDAPEATAEAWRDGWYHTGDALRVDEDGDMHFVDRLRDGLRRRGKNISSYEVEIVVNSHPAIAESAAIGIPEPGGEDELKVVVVLHDGADLRPVDLASFLAEKLPHYMVPRFIEMVEALPRTEATRRVRKVELRAAGVTTSTWDRETHSPRVGRHG